jgi:hypothetical protein
MFIIVGIFSCKSKVNQIVNHQREGKWITIDTLDSIYIAKGKYRMDNEIRTWKYFYNGKMVRKEKYKKRGVCKTKFYLSNGKIMKKGSTKLESNSKEDHWYYYGKWYFYNANGKLDSIKTYEKESIANVLKN